MSNEASRKEDRKEAFAAWLRLARFVKRSEQEGAERLRKWNMSVPQSELIGHIGDAKARGIIQQDLAERMLSTQGNISQLLQGLEQRGLIRREKRGRTNRVTLTKGGEALYQEVVPTQINWHIGQFDALSDAELKELLKLLRKLDQRTD